MKNKKGFTLVELIVVLAILAIIMAVAVPVAFGSIEDAKDRAAIASINNIKGAVNVAHGLAYMDAALQKIPANGMLATIFYQDDKWVRGTSADKNLQDYYFKSIVESNIKIEKKAFVSIVVMKATGDADKPCIAAISYSRKGYTGSGLTVKINYPYYQTSTVEGVYRKYTAEGVYTELK